MGTRGLLGFIIRGKKYGVYMQYDSNLTAVGVDIAKFLMLLTDDEDKLMAKRLRGVGDLGLASVFLRYSDIPPRTFLSRLSQLTTI